MQAPQQHRPSHPSAERSESPHAGSALEARLNGGGHVCQLRDRSATLNRRSARAPRPGGVIQAYAIEREPKLGHLYSVSDDKSVITGMATPNHALYVGQASTISQINQAAKDGMLNFRNGGTQVLFGQSYTRVQAGFKRVGFEGPPKGLFGTTKRDVDMDKAYHQKVAPAVRAESLEKFGQAVDVVRGTDWKARSKEIRTELASLTADVELFKKLVIANQATEDFHDVVNPMEEAQRFVETVESAIYARAATRDSLTEALISLHDQKKAVASGFAKAPHVLDTMEYLLSGTARVAKLLPEAGSVNLMVLHSMNYQQALIESIDSKDPLFYRACDVMASTVLGNKLTHENKDQLKIYGAGGNSGAFHYAARILTAGRDWVSLESFAASARDTEILGLTQQNSAKNLDHSWQYMMYGSIRKRGQTGGEQDNAFELYTRLRYHLKGIKSQGRFRTDQRDKLSTPVPRTAFTTINGIDAQASERIWERLHMNGVFDSAGKVADPTYLEPGYLRLRLDQGDQQHAEAISTRLKTLYATSRTGQRHIQGTSSNEFRNILAWYKLLKLPIDANALDKLEIGLGDDLMAGVDPKALHDRSWIGLMLAMEK